MLLRLGFLANSIFFSFDRLTGKPIGFEASKAGPFLFSIAGSCGGREKPHQKKGGKK
jgi:hypothetical protein